MSNELFKHEFDRAYVTMKNRLDLAGMELQQQIERFKKGDAVRGITNDYYEANLSQDLFLMHSARVRYNAYLEVMELFEDVRFYESINLEDLVTNTNNN